MRKKILVKAPLLSRSGYGEQARIVLRALRTREDLFDIYLLNINWGATACVTPAALEEEEYNWINTHIHESMLYLQSGADATFDLSLQITIPPEFEKIAPVNIGHTAGIETTRVAPEWIKQSNEMIDKIITISEHSKRGLEETSYNVRDPGTGQEIRDWSLMKPVEVINYPVYEYTPEPIDVKFTTSKNFLVVSQWCPRKNLENTVRWFVDEFRDDEDVGLVLKTNIVCDSIIDREHAANRLSTLLKVCGDRKCSVYLLHGELTTGEMTWLYQHPTMKALINIAHGEGYGLPMFEAAYNGLPLVATTWSGQMDFICKPNKKGKKVPHISRVDFDLQPVPKEALWDGIIVEGSYWANAKEASYKRACREILTKEKHFKNKAKVLQKHILKTFSQKDIYHQLVQSIYGEEVVHVDPADIPKISIITSVYDGDDFIRSFLEDMTNQTVFDRCELILINADSPGNEEEVIKEFTDKYDNIVYKRLDKDPGIYGTWNEGVKMATGEYVTNANLDDRKAPYSLELHAKELLLNPDIGLVYADSYITNTPNETFNNNTSQNRRYNFEQFSKEAMLRGNQPHNNPMWRKSLHDKHGLFNNDYRSAGDWEFFLRCAFAGETFKKLDKVLGLYYFNPKGISTNFENFSWKQDEEKEIYTKYKTLFDGED